MSKRKKHPNRLYVNHPRFGNKPIPSDYKYSTEEIERAHWRYSSLEYFPETAIPANTDKQRRIRDTLINIALSGRIR
jgi:hypothetical protein